MTLLENLANFNSSQIIDISPRLAGLFFAFCISKKPSPVGEGGPRQRWMRSYLKIENTSSVTLRVPPSPTGEGYSIFTANFADARGGFFVVHLCQLAVLLCNVEHIGEHILFFARVAKKKRGVIDGGDHKIAFFHPFAVLGGDFIVGADQAHGGDSAKADDEPRFDKAHLLAQIVDADILLCAERIAVFGRTAFEHIGDIHLVALNAHSLRY